ncbi:MAG: hypothetical protein GX024_05245 [Clostridiales bacterium]|nr:hypothetical protein [Clostridiales bacterium]
MKVLRIILTFFIIGAVVIMGLYFLKPNFFIKQEVLYTSPSTVPVQLDNNAEIHFFKNGFAVTSGDTKFFTYEGDEVSPPFSDEELENMGSLPVINISTGGYALVNNRYLYNTSKTPFEMVYKIPDEYEGWDVKELDDMLIVVLKDSDDQLKPQLLKKGGSVPADLSGMEYSCYLETSYNSSNKLISVLTIATDAPNPSTRVFHYADGNSPYGVLSLDDITFYKIYSIHNSIVLIGIHQIMCYNIDGSHMWTLHSPNCYVHQHVNLNNDLLLYFNKARFNKANVIYINETGEMETKEFPHGLTSVQTYKNGHILALDKNNILVLNRKGNIEEKYVLDISPIKLFWTPFSPNHMYVIDKENLLHIYVLGRSNARKDENS